MSSYLANPFYTALRETHASFAVAHGVALRYRPDTIPFAGIPDLTPESFADLRDLLDPGESIFLTTDGDGPLPHPLPGLEARLTLPGLQMAYDAPTPATDVSGPAIIQLTECNAAEMLALKAIAFPGYVGTHFMTLGTFFGVRDPHTGRLVAMGGERTATFACREISALCTHPDYRGRGYAASILRALLRAQAAEGKHSMLSVLADNSNAIALYHQLGFKTTGSLIFHQVSAVPRAFSLRV